MSKTRRNFSPEFKSMVVLQLLREEYTVNELAAKHQISTVVISRWKAEFLEKASLVFQKGPSDAEKDVAEKDEHIAELERKVGQLKLSILLDTFSSNYKHDYRAVAGLRQFTMPLFFLIPHNTFFF